MRVFVVSKFFLTLQPMILMQRSLFVITARNKVAKVLFLHLSVILFAGGVPGQVPPPRPTPPPWDQVHPPWTSYIPDLVHHPDQVNPPARQTATVADGTHPTGMHSYSWVFFVTELVVTGTQCNVYEGKTSYLRIFNF